MTQVANARRLHYGWIVVAVAGTAVLIGAGVRSAPGIFLLPIEDDIGISRSAPTVALTVEAFGSQNVGTVYGWVFFAHQAGAAIAAFGFGLLREETGDYVLAFLMAGTLAVAAGVAALSIKRTQRPIAVAVA